MTRFFGFETIYGVDGEHATPFLTRIRTGRLRIHIFHRGDADPEAPDACVRPVGMTSAMPARPGGTHSSNPGRQPLRRSLSAERSRNPTGDRAGLGRYDSLATMEVVIGAFVFGARRVPPQCQPGKIITIVWQGKSNRKWGFLRNRDGNWCWTPWREYVFGGGKHAPCEPSDGGA
ncbi:MAG: hypothetical protein E5X67_27210 [Mesorhizobium sp.]|uniref:hypothetical protein n=1 Tax=Mesorhizobium sp. TaxID=1871066 RepID=UPI00121776EE|nr:hypothetical protein [Mesorhizobium sp.]TIP24864.1 MAG: hypothetical protein E5X67_27210 [Mesorhizobium sp.]